VVVIATTLEHLLGDNSMRECAEEIAEARSRETERTQSPKQLQPRHCCALSAIPRDEGREREICNCAV